MNNQQQHDVAPVTPESVQRAKQHQSDERRKAEQAAGLRITDDGAFVRPLPRLVVCHCHKPGCLFVAARGTEAAALGAVELHYGLKHRLSMVAS